MDGRRAIVTGAASGIGRCIAARLVDEGARVALFDVDGRLVQEVAAGLRNAVPVELDVSDVAAVPRAIGETVSQLGGLDIVVNNAGFQVVAALSEFPDDRWIRLVQVVLIGTYLVTKYSIPFLRQSGRGRIINISSVHGVVASPLKSAYIAAKHGVVGFTKATAIEEAAHDVTANAVCPGYVKTGLAEEQIRQIALKTGISEEEALMELLAPMAIKRLINPSEVADLVLYLAGSAAASITGAIFTIDGGWTAR